MVILFILILANNRKYKYGYLFYFILILENVYLCTNILYTEFLQSLFIHSFIYSFLPQRSMKSAVRK